MSHHGNLSPAVQWKALKDEVDLQRDLSDLFPQLEYWEPPPPCYCYCTGDLSLKDVIIHLNDDEEWSLDQIADWLDSLGIDLSAVLVGKEE